MTRDKRKIYGGYAKKNNNNHNQSRAKHRGVSVKASEVPTPVVVKKKTPLPPGIRQALDAMSDLSYELDTIDGIPYFTVSIEPDLEHNTWMLLVRGYDPGFEYYSGFQVKYIRGNLVRNPLAKPGQGHKPPRR